MCFSPSLTGRLFQRYQLFCIILFTQTSTHLPFSVAMSRGWTTQGDRMNANAKGAEREKRKNRRFFSSMLHGYSRASSALVLAGTLRSGSFTKNKRRKGCGQTTFARWLCTFTSFHTNHYL